MKEKYRLADHVLLRMDGDNYLALMNADDSRLYTIDGPASGVVRKMDGKKTMEKLLQEAAESHGVDPADYKEDFLALIKDLKKAGLIVKAK